MSLECKFLSESENFLSGYQKQLLKLTFILILAVVFQDSLGGTKRRNYELYNPKVSQHIIYRGAENGKSLAYNHCASLAWFNGKFYAIWNGNRRTSTEGKPGQELAMSTSTDFLNWSLPIRITDPAYSENPFIDYEGIDWQPNLMNYKGKELWCLWFRASGKYEYYGTYFSKLSKRNGAKWVHKKICRLSDLYGEKPTMWVGQNPYLCKSGRVIVPGIWAGGTFLPAPEGRIRKPKWVGAIYTDDEGVSWETANVVNVPENPAASWEAMVHEQNDGKLRMLFRNIELACPPGPTERMLTSEGIGSKKGEPLLFDYDGQYSRIETAHDRHSVIRLSENRWCMFRHDLYSPSKNYITRQNGALYFSRTGKDDFVASRAFKPTFLDSKTGTCSYPQGIEHEGKIYAAYTVGDPYPAFQPRSIEGAVVDPAPDPDKYYIWPRDKDYLIIGGDRSIRMNKDYVYTRPSLKKADGREVIEFKDRGTAGVEIDECVFSKGESLKFSFDIKVTKLQSRGNNVFCSLGDRVPIRIGICGENGNVLSVQARDGWEEAGEFELNQWHSLEIIFGYRAFSVKIDSHAEKIFMNPVFNPNMRLYFGDGYEIDEILSNKYSHYYVDINSIMTEVVEGQALEELNSKQYGPVLRDACDRLVLADTAGGQKDVSRNCKNEEMNPGSEICTFTDKRKEQYYPLKNVNFSKGEGLNVKFKFKVNNAQMFGHTVLCSFGSGLDPVKIGIPGDRPDKLYIYCGYGWQEIGEIQKNEWTFLDVVFGRDSTAVSLGGKKKRYYLNPVIRPDCKFYFGDGWNTNYIPSNTEGSFEIDFSSVSSEKVLPVDLGKVKSSGYGGIYKDATGSILIAENPGNDPKRIYGNSQKPSNKYFRQR